MSTQLRKAVAVVASHLILVMGLAFTQAQSGYAQTLASANRPAVTPDAEELAKQLASVQARIERLEAEQQNEMQNSEMKPAHFNAWQR